MWEYFWVVVGEKPDEGGDKHGEHREEKVEKHEHPAAASRSRSPWVAYTRDARGCQNKQDRCYISRRIVQRDGRRSTYTKGKESEK